VSITSYGTTTFLELFVLERPWILGSDTTIGRERLRLIICPNFPPTPNLKWGMTIKLSEILTPTYHDEILSCFDVKFLFTYILINFTFEITREKTHVCPSIEMIFSESCYSAPTMDTVNLMGCMSMDRYFPNREYSH